MVAGVGAPGARCDDHGPATCFCFCARLAHRYWTAFVEATWAELEEALEIKSQVVASLLQDMLSQFDRNIADWLQAVSCVAQV